MGLPATQENDVETYRQQVESNGGMPPQNYMEATRNRLEWARSVGWIQVV
jgi:hypothetical protein